MSDTRTDLPSVKAPNFEQRVREVLMTYLGRQGNPLDRGLTLRDLLDSGIARVRDGYNLRPGAGTVPLLPGEKVANGEPDLTPPPTPTGFVVNSAISHVFIEHDVPTYQQGRGHLRTRVYGVTVNPGDPLPTFDAAVELTQFTGTVHAHPSNPATTWRLWIKWETNDGVLSPTPAGGTNGLAVTTGQDVTLLLEALQGQIAESQLHQDLGARIDLIDGPASLSGSVAQRVAAEAAARAQAILDEAAARGAAISAEAAARQAGDSSLASQITTLTASVSANAAAIANEAAVRASGDAAEAVARNTLAAQLRGNYTGSDINQVTTGLIYQERIARASGDTALAQDITALTATVANNVNSLTAAIQQEAATRASGDTALAQQITTLGAALDSEVANLSAAIQAESTARANADTALASQINTLQSTVTANTNAFNAAIQSESTARANADTALASQINTLQSTVTTNNTTLTAAIQQEATTRASETGELFAKYTVKIDTNGYVSGFGLASTANNATPFSEFIVRADSFAIASPSGPDITPAEPFFVRTTPTTINGVSVPTGVYIQDGFIQNGTITNAKIANAAIDTAKIADAAISTAKISNAAITAAKIADASITSAKIADAAITNAKIADATITSAKIADASITSAKIADATITSAKIADATITSAKIADASITSAKIANTIQSTNFVAGRNGSGWRIDKSGNMEINSATFRGTIDVRSAASGARLEITNRAIMVFDARGVLRVQLGDLTV